LSRISFNSCSWVNILSILSSKRENGHNPGVALFFAFYFPTGV
jgi:hypothetical protein